MKICHMTSAHTSTDIRIFVKECTSLSNAGYDVSLVAMGEAREENGVHIVGIGEKPTNRGKRMTSFAKKIYKTALELECDIYHLHDPELLPYGLKLKKYGKFVVFDSHEDVPSQILDKTWIPTHIRKIISRIYRSYETFIVKRIDAVVAATPYIAKQFYGRAMKVVAVNNYPKLDDIVFHDTPFENREPIVCYAGGLSEMRGENVMTEAMKGIDAKLILAGAHNSTSIPTYTGENKSIEYVGVLDRKGVNDLYGKAVVGLVLLLPLTNYVNSLPIKMFEYMAAGIPFVASDFELWKSIANDTEAGLCVNIYQIDSIREAINLLLNNRQLAQRMGKNGRSAVENIYNWEKEEIKLIELYASLQETNE